ncbi:MAG TPA: deoxyribonuclease IV [Methanoregulaceae archaeon]|nr:MAG: deoxyribonuclease IV [Methanolinea sp.]HON81068.1 deoxyribonuclease IV [Methanoregulaceae archaeon]HPD10267.1 deoxyribonuclease IV [Methanoregulaceae archaeon]HRT14655.1 deoxyribonuclease IV [Methanoregulaceae archaeon]HRU30225.1 deoxyribonuclease IV [Methanoregulaceae archaeon]
MVRVGVHVSIAGSIAKAVERAEAAGCDTFQIFSRNPRGWAFKELDPDQVALFRENLGKSGMFPAVDHMPYLPNLATGKAEFYEKSVMTLAAELSRCGMLGIPYLVTHLGHHLGEGIEIGRKRVITAVNQALSAVDNNVVLLLENTAGEKNGVGSTFEDIAAVLEGIEAPGRVGVCFDTCHAFGAGYELRTVQGIEETVSRFDDAIGVENCMLIHLNDSKGYLGSGLDRHEHIGLGNIGEEGFRLVLSHPFFRSRPLICETPVDDRRDDAGNIRVVRKLAGK